MNNETKARKVHKKHLFLKVFIVLIVVIYIVVNISINLSYAVQPSKNLNHNLTLSFKPKNQPTWINNVESAMAINGQQILTYGQQKELPTASTAKLVTALVVLKAKPIPAGETGPIITMTPADVAIYNNYVKKNGSVMTIVNGENLNEYQILEGMLLPSADNLADILATWAYGSLSNYANVANQYLKQHHINHTHIGTDASGYSSSTTSTAKDLVKIGELVMKNPVLAQIVNEKQAYDIPVVGTINNLNYLLGADGINGIKTGSTNLAGGVFVGSANYQLPNSKSVPIITAVMGTPDLNDALIDSSILIQNDEKDFTNQQIIQNNQVVGNLNLPWGGNSQILTTKPINEITWYYPSAQYRLKLKPLKINQKNTSNIGQLVMIANPMNPSITVPVKLAHQIHEPLWWTIFHFNV